MGVLEMRALLFVVHIRAHDFGNSRLCENGIAKFLWGPYH